MRAVALAKAGVRKRLTVLKVFDDFGTSEAAVSAMKNDSSSRSTYPSTPTRAWVDPESTQQMVELWGQLCASLGTGLTKVKSGNLRKDVKEGDSTSNSPVVDSHTTASAEVADLVSRMHACVLDARLRMYKEKACGFLSHHLMYLMGGVGGKMERMTYARGDVAVVQPAQRDNSDVAHTFADSQNLDQTQAQDAEEEVYMVLSQAAVLGVLQAVLQVAMVTGESSARAYENALGQRRSGSKAGNHGNGRLESFGAQTTNASQVSMEVTRSEGSQSNHRNGKTSANENVDSNGFGPIVYTQMASTVSNAVRMARSGVLWEVVSGFKRVLHPRLADESYHKRRRYASTSTSAHTQYDAATDGFDTRTSSHTHTPTFTRQKARGEAVDGSEDVRTAVAIVRLLGRESITSRELNVLQKAIVYGDIENDSDPEDDTDDWNTHATSEADSGIDTPHQHSSHTSYREGWANTESHVPSRKRRCSPYKGTDTHTELELAWRDAWARNRMAVIDTITYLMHHTTRRPAHYTEFRAGAPEPENTNEDRYLTRTYVRGPGVGKRIRIAVQCELTVAQPVTCGGRQSDDEAISLVHASIARLRANYARHVTHMVGPGSVVNTDAHLMAGVLRRESSHGQMAITAFTLTDGVGEWPPQDGYVVTAWVQVPVQASTREHTHAHTHTHVQTRGQTPKPTQTRTHVQNREQVSNIGPAEVVLEREAESETDATYWGTPLSAHTHAHDLTSTHTSVQAPVDTPVHIRTEELRTEDPEKKGGSEEVHTVQSFTLMAVNEMSVGVEGACLWIDTDTTASLSRTAVGRRGSATSNAGAKYTDEGELLKSRWHFNGCASLFDGEWHHVIVHVTRTSHTVARVSVFLDGVRTNVNTGTELSAGGNSINTPTKSINRTTKPDPATARTPRDAPVNEGEDTGIDTEESQRTIEEERTLTHEYKADFEGEHLVTKAHVPYFTQADGGPRSSVSVNINPDLNEVRLN
ncbi:hypothetical protein SARC_11825 [Sphaeroforma arctica JP610]|uniref:Uncharacterized protein n=1 Tax=Sphaeroforma arctica JP610 TaxID=667725 RepID=A0A0L0FI04_9EUKA|nr:hypothetical protein SARC_11825 [Sphaeroforma arctica JP610]KNC75653.1 hypothetical protein SARC_11825 [Sphaeroforma arctica JP610]|eukprot:XP_014149555.1 hypothetical protein SARC_11825 [Sphaeroforma arctica JP610]